MRLLICLSLILAVAGCSRGSAPSAGNAVAPAAVVASAAPVAPGSEAAPPSRSTPAPAISPPCDYGPIGPADVQSMLTGPITTVKPAPSDPASCVFSTAGFSSVSVTVRPDGGRETLKAWRRGPATPVSGVGDDAVWEPDLKEIVAARGDALCTVTAMGPEVAPATAETEGAVCRKVFAGR